MLSYPVAIKPMRGTGDLAVAFRRCYVHWFTCKAGASASTYQINDSSDDTGDDVWDCTCPANNTKHFRFNPPMFLDYGCYVDTDANVSSFAIGISYPEREESEYP